VIFELPGGRCCGRSRVSERSSGTAAEGTGTSEALVTGGVQDLADPRDDRAGHRLADVEHLPDAAAGERERHRPGDVARIGAGPLPRVRLHRDPFPPGPDPAQHRFLAPLPVVLAVDGGEP
jgi:hypothetical protein